MKSGVYKFTNLLNNKVYIGSSKDILYRYNEHILGKGNSRVLLNAINKYGIINFTFEILEIYDIKITDTKESFRNYLYEREQYYLDQYYAYEFIKSNGKDNRFRELTYNLNPKSKGNTGSKWSKESILNLKKKIKENGHTCIGRICSEKTRLKMSSVHKERKVSVGINNPNFGVKQTIEKTNKVRDAFIKTGVTKLFNAIKDDIIYGPYRTSGECANELDIWKCQIKKCLSGKPKYKTAKGYTFKYITDEKN